MSVGQLNNTQLEILKAFSHPLSQEDLKELKAVLARFFAKKAIESADKIWDEKEWDNDKMDEFLRSKNRKSKY